MLELYLLSYFQMKKNNNIPVYQQVLIEQNQTHDTRKHIYKELEKVLGMPVLAYFTSFHYEVMIDDSDATMIEGILQKADLSKGLAIIINSPGGSGISAERILNICKSYSGTGEFVSIVPNKAKSAATMVCMGASKIYMGKTSELGPIDPQIQFKDDRGNITSFALCNLIQSYEELFDNAVKEKGNLEPYIQQLANYDARQIKKYKGAVQLSEDLAIQALKNGMMNHLTKSVIQKKIKVFLTPDKTKDHGRPIFYSEARRCGFNIDLMNSKSDLWKLSYELFVRLNNFTSTKVAKCIENKDHSFTMGLSK
jgi:ClpP class serine protease